MVEPYDPLSYDNLARSVVGALIERAVGPLPPRTPFAGPGVYAIYYSGGFAAYASISSPDCTQPIYVGKADPPGGRKGVLVEEAMRAQKLYSRLREHAGSVRDAANLDVADFRCRYLVVQPVWIRLAEQFLVSHFRPIWNCVIDGFGSHVPGIGRPGTKSSAWDVLHPRESRALVGDVDEERRKILGTLRDFLTEA
ncbi:MAG: Eco29kI family restriction endonuclease [Candidatus Brocadiae bacterium]|nr:Eco29kI family restriction endonuclease [Candidatus Brocadiia bacterium]